MASNDELELKLRAVLTNQKQILETVSEGVEKGIIEGSEKALRKVGGRITTAEAQLNAGDYDSVIKGARSNGENLLRILEQVSVSAGGASSSLAQLEKQMGELQSRQRELAKLDPDDLFRFNRKTGQTHYTKAHLNPEAIGSPDEQGRAIIRNGTRSINLDYGGKNWSITNAVHAVLRAMNSGTDANGKPFNPESQGWLKQLTELLKNFGYTLQKVNGQWEANLDTKRIEKEQKAAQQKYDAEMAKITAEKAEISNQIKAEQLVVDNVKIIGDGSTIDTGALRNQAIDSLKKNSEAEELLIEQNHQAARAEAELEDATDKTTEATKRQQSAVGKAVTTFFSYQLILRQVRRLWNDALNTIRELDTQLTNQAIVTDLTRQSAWKLVETYQELGRATGFTTTQIAEVNTEYLRQGNSLKDALVLTEAAAKAARVAGIDARQSVEYLTTAIHGFRLEAEDALEVSDKFAALAADSASNYEDLAIALSKVASQAALAGMSMDYTLALLTTGLDITQEAPESIGTALKTVIARMREISNYGETLEDGMDINQVEEALKYVNIQLRDQNGELRSTQDVLDELGRKWDTLSANQQAAVAKALAGTRQQSRLVAILDNYQDVIKYQEEASLSVGATNAQMQEYLEGMDAAMNRLHVAYESFITAITNNDFFIFLINKLTDFVEKLTKWFKDGYGGLSLIFGIIGALSQTLLPKLLGQMQGMLQNARDRGTYEERINALLEAQYNKTVQLKRATGELTEEQAKELTWKPSVMNEELNLAGRGWRGRIAAAQQKTHDRLQDPNLSPEQRAALLIREETLADTKLTARQRANIGRRNKLTKEEEAKYPQKLKEIYKESLATEKKKLQLAQESVGDVKKKQDLEDKLHNKQLEKIQQEYDLKSTNEEDLQSIQDANVRQEAANKIQEENKRHNEVTQNITEEVNDKQKVVDKAEEEVRKKQEVVDAQERGASPGAAPATDTGTSAASKATAAVGMASAIGSAAMMTMQWGKDIYDQITNGSKKIAQEAITKAQEIQGKIYNNRRSANTITTLTKNFDELNKRVIKTADDLEAIGQVRENLIQELAGEGDTALYENMSDQQLQDAAMARKEELDRENKEQIKELSKTLLGASNDYDVGKGILNVMEKNLAGSAAGAAVGAAAGPWGALIGAAIGGTAGLVAGIIEEVTKAQQAKENKKKVHELLQTEEGVQQVQTLLAYQYQDAINTTTIAGQKLSDSIKSTYSGMIAALNGEELERLLKKYNYDSQALSDAIVNATKSAGTAVNALNDSNSTYADRIKAAQKIYTEYAKIDGELAQTFYRQYQTYFDIYAQLGDVGIAYLDALHLNLNDVNNLLGALQEMQQQGTIANFQEEFYGLMKVMSQTSYTTGELIAATDGWSYAAVHAAAQLIASGNTLDSVAASTTSANSNIANIRETQANWSNMSATERNQWRSANGMLFIDENGKFDEKAWQTFLNGGDMTKYIQRYKAQAQQAIYEEARRVYEAAVLELSSVGDNLAIEEAKLAQITDKTSDEYKEQEKVVKDLQAQYAGLEYDIAAATEEMEEAAHIGELSLADIADKQSQQIEKLKEMYQAEEEELTKSLTKRREAYEKYFDAIGKAESKQEYEQTRNQLISSISRLGGGADSAARTRVNELRQQLAQLEQDRAKQEREDARQAVLDNIDSQIDAISERFDELLNNNQKLLESMDENTHMQYLMYLAQSGATVEEQKLATQQLADLLQGRWGINGLESFGSPRISNVETNSTNNTMNMVINGKNETISMTSEQMKEFIEKMLNTISNITGRPIGSF